MKIQVYKQPKIVPPSDSDPGAIIRWRNELGVTFFDSTEEEKDILRATPKWFQEALCTAILELAQSYDNA